MFKNQHLRLEKARNCTTDVPTWFPINLCFFVLKNATTSPKYGKTKREKRARNCTTKRVRNCTSFWEQRWTLEVVQRTIHFLSLILLVAAVRMRFLKKGGTESNSLKAPKSGTENNSPVCIYIYMFTAYML